MAARDVTIAEKKIYLSTARSQQGRIVSWTPAAIGLGIAVLAAAAVIIHARTPVATENLAPRLLSGYGSLPMIFEPNVGQAPVGVQYVAQGNAYAIALAENGATLKLASRTTPISAPLGHTYRVSEVSRSSTLRLSLVNANRHPRLKPQRPQESYSNYFVGNDPSHWHRHVANFAAVSYDNAYPGIDWVLYGNPQQLEYDFVVAPHANPNDIRIALEGAKELTVTSNGDLLIALEGGEVRQLKPAVYQTDRIGKRIPIEGHFRLQNREVSFDVGNYDPDQTLIIDPALAYATYLGGSNGDKANAIAVDGAGNAYITGTTSSTDFPTLGAFQPTLKGPNAFVTKLNAAGTGLVYSTFLGGSVNELAQSIAVDSEGSAYITGATSSHDFPTVNPIQAVYKGTGSGGGSNAFVTKLNPAGDGLVYSTFLGGSAQDQASGIVVASDGSAYVVGSAISGDFPVANALQGTLKGRINGFISKLNPAGTALVYSTYLGGSAADTVLAVALDSAGNLYVGGYTNSLDFPLQSPFQSTNLVSVNGSTDVTGFFTKINPAGNALVYSSYLGGTSDSEIQAIAVDGTGAGYFAGATFAYDFPVVNPVQNANKITLGGTTGFVTKVDPSGGSLIYSTYLGGSGGGEGLEGDSITGIAVDAMGQAYVTGYTTSIDFPTKNPVQATNNGVGISTTNAFITQFDPTGSSLVFSTFLGGTGSFGNQPSHTFFSSGDVGRGIVIDGADNIFVAGYTGSTDFPVTSNAFQKKNPSETVYGANPNAFVAKFGTEAVVLPPPPANTPSGGGGGGTLGWDLISVLALASAGSAARRRKRAKTLKSAGYKADVRKGVTYYCRYETHVGSRFETKVCGTPDDILRSITSSQELVNQMQHSPVSH